ncbi:MAG: sugar porter family MFS transporter [Actinobacteria bacterium]|nr:sugar porter family MFS transporter [Actinomycetota bacterium]
MEAVKARVDKASAARMAKMVAIGGALLGILYGYDNANAGAAQLFFVDDLGLSSGETSTILTAVPYGILVGCILGSIPTNYIGRKRTTGLVVIGYIVFCLAQAAAFNFASMLVARVLLGFVIGVSLIAVPVFIAEAAATAKRGRVLVGYQLAGVLGIILAFLVAMAVNNASDTYNWRIMFAVAAIPAIFLLPLILKLPETSRWLMMKGRDAEAEEVLRMTEPDTDIEATMADMRAAIADEASGSLWHMFKRPFLRATIFLAIMGLLIQLTGINAFLAYGSIILKDMGFDNMQSLAVNAAINFISFLAVIVAMVYVDRWGRKPIIMWGFGVMAIGLLMVAVAFYSAGGDGEGFNTWQRILGIGGQTIGMAAFNFGVGGTVWAWASESLPSHLRSYGATILLAFDLIANIIVVQWFTSLGDAIGMATVWLIFAVIAIIGIIFVWVFAPETKGRDVDEVRIFWENGGKWPKEPIPAGANLNDLE